ncbi:hypothetical protein HOP50_01g00320 [Chloropicon primus]|uniref:Uncharacterized protein n=1 Tax=Chloropicon primus TaxID=1764295 RepID=A0A5B8MAX1_9CHLO|nr:hypothetical protein A3770_01p00410 [Chloropicon primus]UPQ96742.1 hypothetical protein HOP50_01g00320 [Chloropicon primus]|eukprot:QDZ17523.1 hypothetical protein A3770_01p00410 [Chloropicon primus]
MGTRGMGASLRELMGEEGGEERGRKGGERGEEERKNDLRYFIKTKKGEAVDIIKAAILSRPSARRSSPLKASGEQRYQIESYGGQDRRYESPLAGRLSELLGTDLPGEDGTSRDVVIASNSTQVQEWSPASAMRIARLKARDCDIVPRTAITKSRKKKGAKRSLALDH